MKKMMVLGASGMLGHRVCIQLMKDGFDVVATCREDKLDFMRLFFQNYGQIRLLEKADITSDAAMQSLISVERPDYVVNCIGIVKQLKEASDRKLSIEINSLLPHRLHDIVGQTGGRLIHISTDCVFSGEKGDYLESDVSDAYDIYGKSKYLGETDTSEASAITLRTSIIGHELFNKTSLLSWLLSQKGQNVTGFKKAVFSGLTTYELSRLISTIASTGVWSPGTFHVASAAIDKFSLLQLLAEALSLNMQVLPDETFKCNRALLMSSESEFLNYSAPSWVEMIRDLCDIHSEYGEQI